MNYFETNESKQYLQFKNILLAFIVIIHSQTVPIATSIDLWLLALQVLNRHLVVIRVLLTGDHRRSVMRPVQPVLPTPAQSGLLLAQPMAPDSPGSGCAVL